jgi:hypothetical protein
VGLQTNINQQKSHYCYIGKQTSLMHDEAVIAKQYVVFDMNILSVCRFLLIGALSSKAEKQAEASCMDWGD